MPRGPGKRENYNLDYSRFDRLDADAEVAEEPAADDAAESAGSADLHEMLGRMPPELREAARLLVIGRESNDPVAERRANELVLQAMRKGSPEMQREFIREVSKTLPDAAETLEQDLGLVEPASAKTEDVTAKIDRLRREMEAGAEATRKQLESLQRQQEQIERLRAPEDILKFMHQEGMNDGDLRRIFSGDERHMETCIGGMIDRAAAEQAENARLPDPEKAVRAAEALHATVFGDSAPPSPNALGALAEPSAAAPGRAPAAEEVAIPDYRLQYHKDEAGRYTAVELTCQLPGVLDMSAIDLDVSDKHLRLSTSAPAPRFAVNAGPFPVLLEASAARAKFSKKRQELSVTVPAQSAR